MRTGSVTLWWGWIEPRWWSQNLVRPNKKWKKRIVNCGNLSTELSWCEFYQHSRMPWILGLESISELWSNWVGERKIKFKTGKRCDYIPKIISCASFQDIRLGKSYWRWCPECMRGLFLVFLHPSEAWKWKTSQSNSCPPPLKSKCMVRFIIVSPHCKKSINGMSSRKKQSGPIVIRVQRRTLK